MPESRRMADPDPTLTKRRRLYNAFALSQNTRQDRVVILAFIRKTKDFGRAVSGRGVRFPGNGDRLSWRLGSKVVRLGQGQCGVHR